MVSFNISHCVDEHFRKASKIGPMVMALQGFMRELLRVVELNSCSQHAHQPWTCFRKKTPSPCVGLMYAASFQLMIYPDEDRRRNKNGQENGNLKRMAGSKLMSPHDIRAKGSLDFSLRSAGVVHGKCMVTCLGSASIWALLIPGFLSRDVDLFGGSG